MAKWGDRPDGNPDDHENQILCALEITEVVVNNYVTVYDGGGNQLHHGRSASRMEWRLTGIERGVGPRGMSRRISIMSGGMKQQER